jgi:hypothetical protein
MNILLNPISRDTVSFLNENLVQAFTPLHKKILIIAAAAFACLAAYYLMSHYCFSAQSLEEKKAPIELDEEVQNEEKVSNAAAPKEGISPIEEVEELPQSDEYGTLNGPGKRIDPRENPSYYWLPVTSEGTFENGRLIGHGKVTFNNGTVWEGEFKPISGHDYLNGEGKRVEKNKEGEVETIFEGTFQEHKLHGEGMMFLLNGGTWKGTFSYGMLVAGSIEYKHGSIQSVEGNFDRDGRLEGEGKKIYRNGTVEEGTFEKGVLKTPKKI